MVGAEESLGDDDDAEEHEAKPAEAASRGGLLQAVDTALTAIAEDEAACLARLKGYAAMLAKVCVGGVLHRWLHDEEVKHIDKHDPRSRKATMESGTA